MKLTRSATEIDFDRKVFQLISWTTYPLVFGLQSFVYLRFYYKHSLSFSTDCIALFFVCFFIDCMIVWSYRRASNNDPGFMEERYVSSYSDCDDDQDIELQGGTDFELVERKISEQD